MELRKRLINRELRQQGDEDIKVKELVSKEESYSDDFQSLPLVESSDTASKMDVNERTHIQCFVKQSVQAERRGKSKSQNKGDMKQLFQ